MELTSCIPNLSLINDHSCLYFFLSFSLTFASPQFIDKFESFDKFPIDSLRWESIHIDDVIFFQFITLFFVCAIFRFGYLTNFKGVEVSSRANFKIACYYAARHYHVSCELIRVDPRKDCKKLSSCNDHEDLCMKLDTSS